MVYWPMVAWLAFLCALQANFDIYDAYSLAEAGQDSAMSAAAAGDAAANFDDVARRASPSFRLGRRSSSATAAISPVIGHRWTSADDEDDRFHDEIRRASPSFRLGKRRVIGDDGDVIQAGTVRVLLPVDGQNGEVLVSSPSGQVFDIIDDEAVGGDEQISLSTRASPSFRLGKRGPSFRLGKREPLFRLRRGSPSFRLGKRGSDPTFRLGRQSSAAQPVVILPYYFGDLSDQERLDIQQDNNAYRPHVDFDDAASVVDSDDVDAERQEKRATTFRLGRRDNGHLQTTSMSAAGGEDSKRSVSFRLGKRAVE